MKNLNFLQIAFVLVGLSLFVRAYNQLSPALNRTTFRYFYTQRFTPDAPTPNALTISARVV